MDTSQAADNEEVTQHKSFACAGDDTNSKHRTVVDDSESSGGVSFDTVVAVDDSPTPAAAPLAERPHSARNTLKEIASTSSGKQSKESTPTGEKTQNAWKTLKKSASSLSSKPAAVRKKNDPLMTKFKFSLQKYNKTLRSTSDSQISLKYMYDKLVKMREELLQTGLYKEEELMFDSPDFKEAFCESKEGKPTLENQQSAWVTLKKTASSLSSKPAAVRKKNDPLMMKFKVSLQKYNKALKTMTDSQISLKHMHDKLVKLKEELLSTGIYSEEELTFDSPVFQESVEVCNLSGTQQSDGEEAKVQVEPAIQRCVSNSTKVVDENKALDLKSSEVLRTETSVVLEAVVEVEQENRRCNADCTKLVSKNKELALKLSEFEQKNRELQDIINKNASKGKNSPLVKNPDFLMTKTLRKKIKSTNAKALATEAKLEQLKMENEDLKKQLFETKTALDHVEVLHMQAIVKHQQAVDRIEDMKREVEQKNEETIRLNEVMSEKLNRLKTEFEAFHMENETFRKLVEELKQDYNESLTKCKEASKTWETFNERYALQKQMKDAIASDFVKLGVSYKKLQAAFEEMIAEKGHSKQRTGCRKKISCSKRNKHAQSQKRIPVPTTNNLTAKGSPISKIVAMVGKVHPAQQSGDGPVEQHTHKKTYQDQMSKLEKETTALREENANYAEKQKLLMRQVMRLNKQCHLQLTEKRRHRLPDELSDNPKHLEEEVTALRNKLEQAEERKAKEAAKPLLSDSSSSKTKRSKANYVAVGHTSSKTAVPHSKKKWLKSFWSKDNKPA